MLQIIDRLTVQPDQDAFLLAMFASFIVAGENLDGIFIDAQKVLINSTLFVKKSSAMDDRCCRLYTGSQCSLV